MARVIVVLRVLPSSIDVNLDELRSAIEKQLPEGYAIKGHGVEPIAFGLKALKLLVEMPEETEGGTESLEELIKSIDLVDEVEVETVHRM